MKNNHDMENNINFSLNFNARTSEDREQKCNYLVLK